MNIIRAVDDCWSFRRIGTSNVSTIGIIYRKDANRWSWVDICEENTYIGSFFSYNEVEKRVFQHFPARLYEKVQHCTDCNKYVLVSDWEKHCTFCY